MFLHMSVNLQCRYFAADSNSFRNGKNLADIEMKIYSDMSEIAECFKVNKLNLNTHNINYVCYSAKVAIMLMLALNFKANW